MEGFKYNLVLHKISWPSQALASPPFNSAVLSSVTAIPLPLSYTGATGQEQAFTGSQSPVVQKGARPLWCFSRTCSSDIEVFNSWFQWLAYFKGKPNLLNFKAWNFEPNVFGNSALLNFEERTEQDKTEKFDQIHVSLRLFQNFVFPDARGFVRALGNFCRLQPVGGHGSNAGSRSICAFRRTKSGRHWLWEALIRLDVGIYLGELNLGGVGSGRRWYA